MIETAITVARAVKGVVDIYGAVGAIRKGRQTERYLEKFSSDMGGIRVALERISNHIMIANLDAVRDVTQNRQCYIENLRDVREALEPIQRAIGDDILSSAMIWTPEKMNKAMSENPWEVLLFIQPVALAKPPDNPNLMPIIFEHSGVQYIGWQAKGTLPMLFDCQYENLWVPRQPEGIVSPVSPKIELATSKYRDLWVSRQSEKIVSPVSSKIGSIPFEKESKLRRTKLLIRKLLDEYGLLIVVSAFIGAITGGVTWILLSGLAAIAFIAVFLLLFVGVGIGGVFITEKKKDLNESFVINSTSGVFCVTMIAISVGNFYKIISGIISAVILGGIVATIFVTVVIIIKAFKTSRDVIN